MGDAGMVFAFTLYRTDRLNGAEGVMADGELTRQILTALDKIRFGSVEIVVHDGRIVQIERRERVRLASDATLPRK
jgi:hypothetical protein